MQKRAFLNNQELVLQSQLLKFSKLDLKLGWCHHVQN